MATLNPVSSLLALFPELEPEYMEDLKLFGPEYGLRFHSVFGQLLNPYLFTLLQQDDWLSEPKLPQIFDFIETLSNSGSPEAEELVAVTICERLGDDFEVLRRARHLMGPKTFEFSRDTEIGWGREDP